MTLLDQRMHDLNAALAPHYLLVESPNPDYPYFHLYLKAPIPVSKLLMSLLLDEQGELTLIPQDAATLDHIAKTFLRICALTATADDILNWARDAGHIKATHPAASSGDNELSSTATDHVPDTPAEWCVGSSDEDTASGQWSSATIWEGILRPCARCERDFRDDEYEAQERLDISFRAGYASVFGDENVVRGTFCQHCVKEVLGSWLEVLKDDDRHRYRVAKPKAAYQAYQIEPMKPDE